MDKGMAPFASKGLGAALPFRSEEGKKAAPHNPLLIACARAIPE